ncbi:16S rRNA (uracil(1498)-N(3))-methyltransferase [Parafrigoribacterium mesophilum]|uniref:16S rRNA (uracil(1498)-N(3))-methyltransferase n=1 Tax=Parafrigoribacterium mesophilum TaxID=433646 RepID=UPI0031FDD4B4
MAHFYLNEQLTDAAVGSTVSILGAEARHAVVVSRIRVGETLSIGNGSGLVVTGPVLEAAADRLAIRAQEVRRVPAPAPTLTLVQALAKGGRDELAIQAATELGVDTVIPWAAQRSIVRWQGAKADKGRERWASIVREATKQSLRPWIPAVADQLTTTELARQAEATRMLVLAPGAQLNLTAVAAEQDARDLVLVVGPEGGIAPEELDTLTRAGARAVRLGDAVLRTSTAGPAAIAALNGVLGRW